jgi:hypothetical protein
MFKWFNPTKVSFIRDRLTFYGFKTSIVEPKRLITLFSIVIFPSDITGSELNYYILIDSEVLFLNNGLQR